MYLCVTLILTKRREGDCLSPLIDGGDACASSHYLKRSDLWRDFDACHGNPRLRLSSLTRMLLISGWDCLPPSSCLSFLRRVSDVHLFTTVTFKAHDEQPSQLPNSSISPQIAEDVKLRFILHQATSLIL
uniref:Uncharacterized protein n=1 Tax=Brassica oleracea var. oleracea TaxID=109376 RepID=A0A0D2ZRM1_BRAOL